MIWKCSPLYSSQYESFSIVYVECERFCLARGIVKYLFYLDAELYLSMLVLLEILYKVSQSSSLFWFFLEFTTINKQIQLNDDMLSYIYRDNDVLSITFQGIRSLWVGYSRFYFQRSLRLLRSFYAKFMTILSDHDGFGIP